MVRRKAERRRQVVITGHSQRCQAEGSTARAKYRARFRCQLRALPPSPPDGERADRVGGAGPGRPTRTQHNPTQDTAPRPSEFQQGPEDRTGTRERLFALSICSNDYRTVTLRISATASLYPTFFHRSTWAVHTYTYRLPCFPGLFAPLRGSVVPYRRPVRAGLAEHCSARTSKPVH